MWSSRLFRRLFLAYACVNAAAVLAFFFILAQWQQAELADAGGRRLDDAAQLLRRAIEPALIENNQRRLAALVVDVATDDDLQVTVLDAEGNILATSPASQPVEGSDQWVELQLARSTGRGRATRLDPRLGRDVQYLLLPVGDPQQPLGFVRVAAADPPPTGHLADTRTKIWLVFFLVSLANLGLTYWAVARITRPLTALTVGVRTMFGDDEVQQVMGAQQDEFNTLGAAFSRMTEELATRITQLRQNNERLATVLGGMVEGVVAVDDEQRILFANGAARSLLEFVTPDTEGRPLLEAVRTRTIHRAVQSAFASRQPIVAEFELTGATRRVVAVHAARLPGDPCPGVVLVLHDVTELRRLENLRQEFVANVSHELKTPLTSIKAYAETLLDGALDDAQNNVKFVRRIQDQADRLYELILDLLSLARIESGQGGFEIDSVHLAEVIEACVSHHAAAAASNQIELAMQPSPSALRVRADEEGLRQIFDNLLSNAIKYTPAGGRVSIRWQGIESSALIEVEDTGIGIPPEAQARIFERFYRVDKARSRELGGTGLGLSIVKHLVQQFGGTVGVTSSEGSGTTFTVRLPLDQAGQADEPQSTSSKLTET